MTSASAHTAQTTANNIDQATKWGPLVARIRQGDREAVGELYQEVFPRLRFYLINRLDYDAAYDVAQAVFLKALEQITAGNLRDPEALLAYLRTMASRYACDHRQKGQREEGLNPVLEAHLADQRKGPESEYGRRERLEFALRVLQQMPDREREILTRFYLYEQTQEQIMREMGLTKTQFRLLKSRAKARFGQKGQRQLQQRLCSLGHGKIAVQR